MTGLRKGELASLTVASCTSTTPLPYAALDAADEKNREGNDIALRDDLAADLRAMAGRQAGAGCRAKPGGQAKPIPARLPADTPVFDVPDKLSARSSTAT